jgi:hypothetical protein
LGFEQVYISLEATNTKLKPTNGKQTSKQIKQIKSNSGATIGFNQTNLISKIN